MIALIVFVISAIVAMVLLSIRVTDKSRWSRAFFTIVISTIFAIVLLRAVQLEKQGVPAKANNLFLQDDEVLEVLATFEYGGLNYVIFSSIEDHEVRLVVLSKGKNFPSGVHFVTCGQRLTDENCRFPPHTLPTSYPVELKKP